MDGMSADELEKYYTYTNISVVTLKKSEDFKYTIPSKIFQIMGRGIAVLYIGPEGEAADIIRKYGAGIVLTGTVEEDLGKLAEFFLKNNWQDELIKMGRNGSKAVLENYSRKKLAREYLNVLEEAAK